MIYTQSKAIKMKCLECSGTRPEVVKCPIRDCALWPYRLKGCKPRTGDELEVLLSTEKYLEAERALKASKKKTRPNLGEALAEYRRQKNDKKQG